MTHIWLEQEVAPFVSGLFHNSAKSQYPYHNLKHTRDVVARALEIAKQSNVSEDDQQILTTAAWFHDTGHLNGGIENHEARSVAIMKDFMQQRGIDDQPFIDGVAACIMATVMPQDPKGLLQEIMCDADTYHFGTEDFKKSNKAVKKELEDRHYEALTKKWNGRAMSMMEQHRFFTPYAKDLLGHGKAQNIKWLQEKIAKKAKHHGDELPVAVQPAAKANDSRQAVEITNPKIAQKEKADMLSKGVQSMLRITSGNHLRLSYLADRKANLLISVNAIIISIILSQLLRRLDAETWLTVPTITFLATSVATIVISILATMPKVSSGNFTRSDVEERRTNLMFFGNFYKASREDYEWAMDELMSDKDYIYHTMVRDIYYLGVVLGRKYKLIRVAYYVFMIGIVISVIAFSFAILIPHGNTVTVTNGKLPPF